MRLHPNAKTTPMSRQMIVDRVRREGWSVADAAEAAGVSERTVHKWLRRFREEGLVGLRDRSSRPHRCPFETPRRLVRRIEALRRKRRAAWQIGAVLRMPVSTVSVVLRRLGLGRLRALDPRPAVRRYERERPGELLHVDIKPLARIRRVGHRIHGDRSRSVDGAGYEYAHVAVDDTTRLAYVEILPDQRERSAREFLLRAARWFGRLGVRIERILTDNGSCYRSHGFARECRVLGARHIFTRPYRPQCNGKAERFIQTLIRGWAYGRAYKSSAWRARALPGWLRYYHQERPHRSLKNLTPLPRLQGIAEQRP